MEPPSIGPGHGRPPRRRPCLRHREEELFRQHRPISHCIKTRRKPITAFKTVPTLDTPFAKSRVTQTTRNQKQSEADTRLRREQYSKVCWGPRSWLSGSRPYIPDKLSCDTRPTAHRSQVRQYTPSLIRTTREPNSQETRGQRLCKEISQYWNSLVHWLGVHLTYIEA